MNEWAVVLGVSGVTGAAVARAVARSPGLDVWGLHRGRHASVCDALQRDLVAWGREAVLEACDAAPAVDVQRHADRMAARLPQGSVRLLAHALAGASIGHLVSGAGERLRPDQYTRTFDVMAHSFNWWTAALLDRGLLAPGARIVAFTNPLVDSVTRGTAAITASKAALEQYVRHLAFELGPLGYRVNLVQFGAIVSPAVRRTFGDEEALRLAQTTAQLGPAGRLCAAEEVGDLISLLLDPRASWFNGALIDFTGGEFQSLYDAVLHPRR